MDIDYLLKSSYILKIRCSWNTRTLIVYAVTDFSSIRKEFMNSLYLPCSVRSFVKKTTTEYESYWQHTASHLFPFLLICVGSHSLAYHLIMLRSADMIGISVLFPWANYPLCWRLLSVILFCFIFILSWNFPLQLFGVSKHRGRLLFVFEVHSTLTYKIKCLITQ